MERRPVQVWMLPEQEAVVRAVLELASATASVVGCDDDHARPTLAAGINAHGGIGDGPAARPAADLRNLLASAAPADGPLVLFDSGMLLRGDRAGPDAELLREARERGVAVLTLEPLPPTAPDLMAAAGSLAPTAAPAPVLLGPADLPLSPERGAAMRNVTDLVWLAGLARHAPGFSDIPDLLAQFGAVHSMAVVTTGSRAEGSLRARMADGLDLLALVMGQPESVMATVSKQAAASAVHCHATAQLRYGQGRSATLMTALRGGSVQRHTVLTGPGGRLEISGSGLVWTDDAGKVIDRSKRRARHLTRAGEAGEQQPYSVLCEQVAKQLRRVLDSGTSDVLAATGRPDIAMLVATINAAELSSETGASERPATHLSAGG